MDTRELTSTFSSACKSRGLWPALEQRWPSPVHRSGKFRPDCVIYENGRPICAVEFKKYEILYRSPMGRQYRAYESMGIPWRYCTPDTLEETLGWLDSITNT